jgi:TRAP-type mannitol/chloroaromatic compound transport system permease small subunit
MLGSIVALRRGEHMRMTAIVGKLPPHRRAFLDLIAIAAALAFLLFVVRRAYEFAADEMFVTIPSLEIANSWRAAALPIGIALMILVGFLQIFRFGRLWTSILALGTVAAAVAITALLGPYLQGLGNWNLLIFFVLGAVPWISIGFW